MSRDYSPEMQKFLNLLDEHGFKYGMEYHSYGRTGNGVAMYIERCHVDIDDDTTVSVIHGFGTYGGIDILSGEDSGLLEVANLYRPADDVTGDPIGDQTAEEAFEIVKQYKRRKIA